MRLCGAGPRDSGYTGFGGARRASSPLTYKRDLWKPAANRMIDPQRVFPKVETLRATARASFVGGVR